MISVEQLFEDIKSGKITYHGKLLDKWDDKDEELWFITLINGTVDYLALRDKQEYYSLPCLANPDYQAWAKERGTVLGNTRSVYSIALQHAFRREGYAKLKLDYDRAKKAMALEKKAMALEKKERDGICGTLKEQNTYTLWRMGEANIEFIAKQYGASNVLEELRQRVNASDASHRYFVMKGISN